MKIVVCDDNRRDLAEIDGLLAKYKKSNTDARFDVVQFTDSTTLYQKIQEENDGDIYLLDMIMENKTGIDLGSLIQRMDGQSAIIYITSSNDYALEAYHVHAIRYLLKPIREELFFEALDYAISNLSRTKKDAVFQVKTKKGLMSIPYPRIEYVENYSRTLNIHLTNKTNIQSIFLRKSFDEEIQPLAEDKRFLHVHKSFLVNMDHIDQLTQKTILMESGKEIPVSKAKASDVKKDYLMYVSEKYQ